MTSSSTLARRARAEKNPRKAKALRAKANQARRDEREAKAFQQSTIAELDGLKRAKKRKPTKKSRPMTGLPGRNKIIKGLKQALQHVKEAPGWQAIQPVIDHSDVVEAQNALNQMRAASVDHMALAEQPGHGEVVGGYLAHMADQFAKLARKKGGVDAIQARLMTLEHQTRHDAKFEARQNERKAVQAVREEMRDKTVCGFLAVVAAADVTGAPPAVWCINAFTVANLVDALKANGYRADGKR